MLHRFALLVFVVEATTASTVDVLPWEQQVEEAWRGNTEECDLQDLFNEYSKIFPNYNRNAASHRWSTFVLQRSTQMSRKVFEDYFHGFCPVSGSPINPRDSNRYLHTLPMVGS